MSTIHYPLPIKGFFFRQDSCIEFISFYCSDIPMVQSINCNSYVKTLEKHLCVTVTVQYQILHLQTKWVITH